MGVGWYDKGTSRRPGRARATAAKALPQFKASAGQKGKGSTTTWGCSAPAGRGVLAKTRTPWLEVLALRPRVWTPRWARAQAVAADRVHLGWHMRGGQGDDPALEPYNRASSRAKYTADRGRGTFETTASRPPGTRPPSWVGSRYNTPATRESGLRLPGRAFGIGTHRVFRF